MNEEIHKFRDKERTVQFKWTMDKLDLLQKLYWFLRGMDRERSVFSGRQLEALETLLHRIETSFEFPPQDVSELKTVLEESRQKQRGLEAQISDMEAAAEHAYEEAEEKIMLLGEEARKFKAELEESRQTCSEYLDRCQEMEEVEATCEVILKEAGIPERAVLKGENTQTISNITGKPPTRKLGLNERVGMLAAKLVELQNKMKPKSPFTGD